MVNTLAMGCRKATTTVAAAGLVLGSDKAYVDLADGDVMPRATIMCSSFFPRLLSQLNLD